MESVMARPRLLLIDDEPNLASFIASAASECGFDPFVTTEDVDFRLQFLAQRPAMVALDLGMPGADGVEQLRFLASNEFKGPVLIVSGFDRRVLESAYRLGETLGLTMVGPIEKPIRLEILEELLSQVKGDLTA